LWYEEERSMLKSDLTSFEDNITDARRRFIRPNLRNCIISGSNSQLVVVITIINTSN
jgi:hypothetical protein